MRATLQYSITVCLASVLICSAALAQVQIEGTVDALIYDDIARGRSKTVYFVVDEQKNEKYHVRFSSPPSEQLMSGMRVRLNGKSEGNDLVVDGRAKNTVQVLDVPVEKAMERTIAVILVNFSNSTLPCSRDDIAYRMFPDPSQTNLNVASNTLESSYGLETFRADTDGDGYPDVFGPYTISARTSDPCAYSDWGYQADDLATMDGVDLSRYRHKLYVIPSNSTCGWGGIANLGCSTQCRAWVAYCAYPGLYAHELGHNLGMHHATSDTNNDGVKEDEYGDHTDLLGYPYSGWRQNNAPHKHQMGWFQGYTGKIVDVTQNGTYYVAPLHMHPSATSLPQVLRVRKASTGEHYYFAYRIKAGYDAGLRTEYADRLSVHRFSSSLSGTTFYITALADGASFQDASLGVTVTQVAHSSDPVSGYSQVSVNFSGSTVGQTPTLTVSPVERVTKVKGSSLTYTVTVKNNDALGSNSTSFSLGTSAPSGWSASCNPAVLVLAPGETGSSTLTVTSPTTASDNRYQSTVSTSASGHPSSTAWSVYVLDTQAPTAPSNLTAKLQKNGGVSLTWTGSSDSGSGGVTYAVFRNAGSGYQQIGTTSTTSFKDSNTKVSVQTTFYYHVVASDAAGNQSAASNVASVEIKSTGKQPRK